MKPKTKLQKRVAELNKQLPKITDTIKNYAYKHCFNPMAMVMRKTIFCLDCGHKYKDESVIEKFNKWIKRHDNLSWEERKKNPLFSSKCPSCKKKMEFTNSYKNGLNESCYFDVVTTIDDFQVYRIFEVSKHMKKNEKPHFYFTEVVQNWIGNNGSYTVMAVNGSSNSYYVTTWKYGDLTIKPDTINDNRYNLYCYKSYPKKKYLPVVEQKGFLGNTYGIREHIFMSCLLSSTIFETLVKSKDKILVKKFIDYKKDFIKYWPSIKICLRNNYYPFNGFGQWRDYIQLLEYFGKDIHSPKLICPDDLNKAHDRYVQKKREIQRKQDAEKTRLRMEADNISYLENKSKFFGLKFESGNITIETIKSVQQVMEESDLLKHCAFTNEYHNKSNSLLMSVRVDGVVTKTAEIDVQRLHILQCRGFRNDISGEGKYHKAILKLIAKNLYQIRNIVKPKKVKTVKQKEAA